MSPEIEYRVFKNILNLSIQLLNIDIIWCSMFHYTNFVKKNVSLYNNRYLYNDTELGLIIQYNIL
jgi:hypothetical protein